MRDKQGFRRFYGYAEETGLDLPIRDICRAHHVSMMQIYMDDTGPTVHAARLETWAWLTLYCHKSPSEIGRMFDRDSSSIAYALKRMQEVGAKQSVAFAIDTIRPLAVLVAATSRSRMQEAGRRAAARNNAK